MEELYTELQRRGFGLCTDRELAASLGWSKSRVNRAKVILSGKGLIAYRVVSRRGGTEYAAGQCGTKRDKDSGTKRGTKKARAGQARPLSPKKFSKIFRGEYSVNSEGANGLQRRALEQE